RIFPTRGSSELEGQLRAVFVLAPRRDGERAVEGGDGRFKALGLALLRARACERPAEAQEARARVRFADVARIARGERKLQGVLASVLGERPLAAGDGARDAGRRDRKSTRLNSS